MMSIRRLYGLARSVQTKIEKPGVGRPLLGLAKIGGALGNISCLYMQIIWQNRKKNIKLIYSFKGSGRSGEYLVVELEGTARYVG